MARVLVAYSWTRPKAKTPVDKMTWGLVWKRRREFGTQAPTNGRPERCDRIKGVKQMRNPKLLVIAFNYGGSNSSKAGLHCIILLVSDFQFWTYLFWYVILVVVVVAFLFLFLFFGGPLSFSLSRLLDASRCVFCLVAVLPSLPFPSFI